MSTPTEGTVSIVELDVSTGFVRLFSNRLPQTTLLLMPQRTVRGRQTCLQGFPIRLQEQYQALSLPIILMALPYPSTLPTAEPITLESPSVPAALIQNLQTIDNVVLTLVPEPSTYALLFGLAVIGWVFIRRRK
jgi:hypothetical protein